MAAPEHQQTSREPAACLAAGAFPALFSKAAVDTYGRTVWFRTEQGIVRLKLHKKGEPLPDLLREQWALEFFAGESDRLPLAGAAAGAARLWLAAGFWPLAGRIGSGCGKTKGAGRFCGSGRRRSGLGRGDANTGRRLPSLCPTSLMPMAARRRPWPAFAWRPGMQACC